MFSDDERQRRSNDSDVNHKVTDGVLDHKVREELDEKEKEKEKVLSPSSHLPKPDTPPGLLLKSRSNCGEDYHKPSIGRSLSQNSSEESSIGMFLRQKRTALAKRISFMKQSPSSSSRTPPSSAVTEFHLSGVKVIVEKKKDENGTKNEEGIELCSELKGRISFFSRSNSRDCSAVRTFFREKGLKYVEINVDVFPERERELAERTGGSTSVPQIFFNDNLLGGLMAFNSLRNSGELEKRLRGMAGGKCPDTAPRVPVYGFDDDGEKERQADELLAVMRFLRQRLPIQDWITKMKLVKNCFTGADLVEAVIDHLDCGRRNAVQVGKELARKHFIHHVYRENDFEDGNQLYRFLEHDPMIFRCFNFRVSVNDNEPKPAVVVGQRLTKLMFAVLEAYASDDRRHLDYHRIGVSEEFRRYVNLVRDLQRIDVFSLSTEEKQAFFMNLYNAMVIHAVISIGRQGGDIDRRFFFNDFCYIIGGYSYSLSAIKNGILRSNRRQPYSFAKPFGSRDRRLELVLPRVNPLIHFGLCDGARSSPGVRFFSAEGIEIELRQVTREFFQAGAVQVDLEKRTVYLTSMIKRYGVDFVPDKEILVWIVDFLDATKAGLLTHLLSDGSPVNTVYLDFDWSLNT